MRSEHQDLKRWTRALSIACIAVAGIVTIVGSGGGIGFLGDDCAQLPPGSCAPLPPTVAIVPARVTVQVGASAMFTAQPTGVADPTYQWQRSADGGQTFVDIAGAVAATYTLAGANLADDATTLRVLARSRGVTVAEGTSRLAVSSASGVVFEDADFASTGWEVSDISVPPNNGATHTEQRVASGGNPDAFRRMTHAFPPTQQSLGVVNLAKAAVYDPALHGAIYVIDYAEDCVLISAGNPTFGVFSSLVIDQAGRRYRPSPPIPNTCSGAAWMPQREAASLAAADFELLEGPACSAGEACPDFSVSAPVLRFGFVRFAQANTTPTVHGIDNWKVTLWRH